MKTKIILLTIALTLIVSLSANLYLISQQSNLTNQVDNLTNENAFLQIEKQTLVNQSSTLTHENQVLQNNNTALKEQLRQYEKNSASSKLSNSRGWLVTSLGVTDVTSFLELQGVPRLFIQGTMSNIGNSTAFDCVLYIKLYQSGVLTYEVYRHLGNLESGSHVDVYENIVYTGRVDTGSALSSWVVIPLFAENLSQTESAISG